jgi:hypothetical protein
MLDWTSGFCSGRWRGGELLGAESHPLERDDHAQGQSPFGVHVEQAGPGRRASLVCGESEPSRREIEVLRHVAALEVQGTASSSW